MNDGDQHIHQAASSPRVWVKRIAIVESLRDPFPIIPGRDIHLHRGLNIVWGIDTPGSDADLMAGHGVGKTLFCRLIRYALGEDRFVSHEFQQKIEGVLPEAYLGAEVEVLGRTWSVLRPLCREKSQGRGIKRDHRPEYGVVGAPLEELFRRIPRDPDLFATDGAMAPPDQSLVIDLYQAALKEVARQALPEGMSRDEEPFTWSDLLQWFARDQEARYVDVMVLRSSRSRTVAPLDHEHSDLLIRSALRLADANEARLSLQVRRQADAIRSARAENERNGLMMKALTAQLLYRHTGQQMSDLSEADSEKSILTADIQLAKKISDLEPLVRDAYEAVKTARRHHEAAYYILKPLEDNAVSLQNLICEDDIVEEDIDAELKDLEEVKRLKQVDGDKTCRYCGDPVDTGCNRRLAEEEVIRHGIEEERKETRLIREERRQRFLNELKSDSRKRAVLGRRVEMLKKRMEHKLSEYEQLERSIGRLRDEHKEVRAFLRGALAAKSGIPSKQGSPLRIHDIGKMERRQKRLEEKLAVMRDARTKQFAKAQHTFSAVADEFFGGTCPGTITLSEGRLRFSVAKGGETAHSLTVILVDLSTLLMTAQGNANLPGIVVHDSPREADMRDNAYRRVFTYIEDLTKRYGGNDHTPFQYIITTTTDPPPHLQGSDYTILKLWSEAHGNADGLLLRHKIVGEV